MSTDVSMVSCFVGLLSSFVPSAPVYDFHPHAFFLLPYHASLQHPFTTPFSNAPSLRLLPHAFSPRLLPNSPSSNLPSNTSSPRLLPHAFSPRLLTTPLHAGSFWAERLLGSSSSEGSGRRYEDSDLTRLSSALGKGRVLLAHGTRDPAAHHAFLLAPSLTPAQHNLITSPTSYT